VTTTSPDPLDSFPPEPFPLDSFPLYPSPLDPSPRDPFPLAHVPAVAGLREPVPADLRPFRAGSADEARRLLEDGLARRVIADVLVAVDAPDSRAIRALAIALLIPDEARTSTGWVIGFGTAAWLHTGFAGTARQAPEELQVIIPPGRRRPRAPRLRARQVALAPDQITFLNGIPVTDPLRTAADVARDLPAPEALTVLRRLGELTGVLPEQVLHLLSTMRYGRGAATGRQVVKSWAEQR
jgi:hypothetical protein